MLRRNVLVAVVAVGLVAAACGGDSGSGTATPAPAVTSATATTVPAAEAGGDDGFRAFARVLNGSVMRGDVGFIEARLKTVHEDCLGPDVNKLGGPVCETLGAGYEGMSLGYWRSEGATVPAATVVAAVRRPIDEQLRDARDQFGSGAARIAAIDVDPAGYDAVLTAMIARPGDFSGTGPLRVSIGTSWVFDNGEWRMTGALVAYVLAEELLTPGLPESPYPHLEPLTSS